MPEQTKSATITSQAVAVPPVSGTPLAIEIAKVPDGKTLDPHWTTYLQATATPFVAVVAAVIAATIQWRQWRTANFAAKTAANKLKLDMFSHRFAMYETAREMIICCSRKGPLNTDELEPLVSKLRGIEFLFDDPVADFVYMLVRNIDELWDLQSQRWLDLRNQKTDGSSEEFLALDKLVYEKQQWFMAQRDKLKQQMRPFLQLSHEVKDA